MGEVYRARDEKLGRDVAIKVLPDEFARDLERRRRFQREAKVLASLNHPNIGSIYGLEQSESTHYLVLELVPGETLAERNSRGPIPVDEALEIFKKIAEALEEAHEHRIVHRDLKPANIKLTADDKIKVLDFGVAKAFMKETLDADSSDSPTLTRGATGAGVIMGTAAYMSPEQARGKDVDKRTDIWAFGCCLYEALTQKRLFARESVTDTLSAVTRDEPDWTALPADTPDLVVRLLERCLRKDRESRVSHIGAARFVLAERAASERPTAPNRWRAALGVAAAALVLAITLLAWSFTRGHPAPSSTGVTRFFVELASDFDPLSPGKLFALSADGQRIVHQSRGQLYLRTFDSFESVPIANTEGGYSPFFSPDGEWIAFFTSTQLKKVALGGGAGVTIAEVANAREGVWSPRGQIVFDVQGPTGLLSVDANGGVPNLVTELADGEPDHGHMGQLLPGGNHVLFGITHGNWDKAQIVALSLEDGETEVLLEGGESAVYVPTGHLVYAQAGDLLAVPFDRTRMTVTGRPMVVVKGVLHTTMPQFALAPTGTLAYIPATDGGRLRDLVWVSLDGGEESLGFEPSYFIGARLSPDGSRVAVGETDVDLNVDVRIYDVRRANLARRLTTQPGIDQGPVWTPDGESVVYVSTRDGGSLYSRSARHDQEIRLAQAWWQPQSISADGDSLLYISTQPDTGFDIGVLSLQGRHEPRTLFGTSFEETSPAFSPDGRHIAYTSTES
jgi:serine/threonine-protein kinase